MNSHGDSPWPAIVNPHRHRPWPDLLPDILKMIANRLQFGDYARFGAVCKPWRSITAGTPHLRALQLPWLAILDNSTFFSPLQDQFHRRNLPTFTAAASSEECICLGSSEGCLIFTHKSQGIHIFNPFTDQTIDLPCSDGVDELDWDLLLKIILSSNPFSSAGVRQCIVVARCSYSHLAFCRPGDPHWVYFDPSYGLPYDVVFYKGLLHGVIDSYNIMVYEFGPGPKITYKMSCIAVDSAQIRPLGKKNCDGCDGGKVLYLVELAGELVLVIKYWEFTEKDWDACRTFHFRVYRLDFSGPRWVEVESLGDKMLLLSEVCLMCVDTVDFSAAGFRPNCIYFTDGELDQYEWRVFCLEDKKIRPFSPASSYSIRSPLFWIKPI